MKTRYRSKIELNYMAYKREKEFPKMEAKVFANLFFRYMKYVHKLAIDRAEKKHDWYPMGIRAFEKCVNYSSDIKAGLLFIHYQGQARLLRELDHPTSTMLYDPTLERGTKLLATGNPQPLIRYNPASVIQAAYRMRMPPAVPGIRAVMRKGKIKPKYSASAVASKAWDEYMEKNRTAIADILNKRFRDDFSLTLRKEPDGSVSIEDNYKTNIIGGIPLD